MQFDLRFYIVALVFLIFDVEVALFYPWAVAYGSAAELASRLGMTVTEIRAVALVDMLFFFGVLLVGFATTSIRATYRPGFDLRREARVDRPI